MFRTAVLASGSKGNAIVAYTDTTAILLDAGITAKRCTDALQSFQIDTHKLCAIVISHEHSDHIKGVGVLLRKLQIPLYITRKTYEASKDTFGEINQSLVRHFAPGDVFEIGDLSVHAIASSHDAVEGCNFTVSQNGNETAKLAVVTDLGYSSRLLLTRLQNVTTLILESNHDIMMLHEGPYPWHLKQRVKSQLGHLSNEQAVGVITQIIHDNLRNIVLAHLSETNNSPSKAIEAMRSYLDEIRHPVRLHVAEQNQPTCLLDV